MRGRKAAQIVGIEQYDFDKLAKAEGSPRERRRFLAFAHLREGKTLTETAASVRVDLRSLLRWIKRFRREGLEGLKDKVGRGAKPLIPAEHQEAFRQAVLELQEKRVGGRIRGKDVLELMQTKYGINPTLKTVSSSLKRANLVWITGRSIHPKADLEAQEAFKKTSKTKSWRYCQQK